MNEKAEQTKLLLAGGVLAGPIYILVGMTQIVTREGFDVTRHPLSMMSLGDLGWVQITNFIVTGLLVIAGAISLRRLAQGDKRLIKVGGAPSWNLWSGSPGRWSICDRSHAGVSNPAEN